MKLEECYHCILLDISYFICCPENGCLLPKRVEHYLL
jgi:hypothetical protein